MRVLRSSLFVAATAIIAAACGDKVTIPPATTAAAKINSVLVAPSSATISTGQAVTLSAAVNADAGLTTSVAWTTSSSGSAALSAATNTSVVVTGGNASPGVAVCAIASATGAASVTNCATVVVQPAATVVPAVIQIASITGANLNTPVAVPPGAVAGQINVSVNVNPGTEKMDSVQVLVGGKVAGQQTFSAAQAAALRSAANDAASDQALQSTLVFSINTAAFNPATGAVTWQNGLTSISVIGYGHQGASAATNSVSQSIQLLFGNANGFQGTLTTSGGASASDGAGYAWKSGAITITALPVIYSPGLTIGNVNISYGGLGCSAGGLQTINVTALTGNVYSATFSNTATSGTRVTTYEFNPAASGACAAALNSGGEVPAITAIGSDNNNVVLVGGGANGGAGFLNAPANTLNPDPNFIVRLDNVAPAAPTATLLVNGRTNNWINDAVVLNATQSPAIASGVTNGTITVAAADLGSGRLVGGITYTARTGLSTDASATVDGNAAVTSSAALAESANNTTYRVRLRSADPLGNPTNISVGNFGVDRTAPTLTQVGGPVSPARSATGPIGNFIVAANDPSTAPAIGSGFFNLGLNPLLISQARLNATNNRFFCPGLGYIATASTNPCTVALGATLPWTSGTTPTFAANLSFPDVEAGAGDSYNTSVATIIDQAGNTSAAVSLLELDDATASAVGGLSYAPGIFSAGGSATFSSTVTDNLDLQLVRMNLVYGTNGGAAGLAAPLFDANTGANFAPSTAAGGATFYLADTPINVWTTAFPATLIPTYALNTVAAALNTNFQTTTNANGNAFAATNVGNNLMQANAFAMNQANTLSAPAAVGIPISAIPAQASITTTGTATNGPIGWAICNITGAAATACANPVVNPPMAAAGNVNVSRAGTTAATPLNVTITAVAEGVTSATSIFGNPFSAVQFYAYCSNAVCAGAEGWRFIGSVNSANATTDNLGAAPLGRNWYFSATLTPSLAVTPVNGAYRVMAVGIIGSNVSTLVGGVSQVGMAVATPLAGSTVTVVP